MDSVSKYLPWSPACDEYFQNFAQGRYDSLSQIWFILPVEESYLDHVRGAFVVGRPGCDGIEFCFRAGERGIWAYYPIEERWEIKAGNLVELEQGWLSGSITV
jgi:hypothetical protein